MSLAALTVKIGADLSGLNQGLASANQSVQTFGAGMARNATAPIQRMTSAATGAGTSFKALREPLTSVTRQLLQLNPAVAQVSSVLGTLAIGTGPMIGILAGIAAISLGWRAMTKDARDNAKATDDAIAALTKLRDRQRLGSHAGTLAKEAEKAGTERAELQREEAKLISKVAGSFSRKIGGDPVLLKQLTELQREIAELTSIIDAHKVEVQEIRDTKEKAAWEKFFSQLSAKVKARKTELASVKDGQREFDDFLAERNTVPLPNVGTGMQVAGQSGPLAGFQFIPSMFAQVGALQMAAATALKQAADEQAAAAKAAKDAALQSYALSQASSLLSQHGGAVGGVLSGAISGYAATGGNPVGAAIGGGVALVSALFGNRKSVDRNTEAVNRLAEVMNAPSGYKVDPARYRAQKSFEGDFNQRGGIPWYHAPLYGGG